MSGFGSGHGRLDVRLFNLDSHEFISLTNSLTHVSCLGLSQLARTTHPDTLQWIPIICIHVGCNLDAIEPSDPTRYAGLGEFFYRKLKPGVLSVDNSVLVSGATFVSRLQRLTVKRVSPVDGTLHGTIDGMRVEEVKDITNSLDALLCVKTSRLGSPTSPTPTIVDDHEFANVNGTEYSLDQLLGSLVSDHQDL